MCFDQLVITHISKLEFDIQRHPKMNGSKQGSRKPFSILEVRCNHYGFIRYPSGFD